MATEFFKNFPKIQYKLNDGRIIYIKDFFRKSKIEQEAVQGIVDYTKYEIQEGERPDIVATKLYGNPDLHWLFFVVNEIENYYDWHMDNQTFQKYLDKKYHGQFLVFDQSTSVVSATSKYLLGEKITSTSGLGRIIEVDPTHKRLAVDVEKKFVANEAITGAVSEKSSTPASVVDRLDGVYKYKNSDGVMRNTTDTGFSAVTFRDHEIEENEAKRLIKIVRPELVDGIVRRFEKIMLS